MRTAGFTLVEMLIALSIFALLSIGGVSLLSFSIDSRQRTTERLDSLASVVRTRSLLTADLAQATPRTWRDESGLRRPAFAGNSGEAALQLVRGGWANDGAAPRSSLQRVAYRLDGDRLVRTAAPMVDGTAESPPAVLLTGVTSLKMRFHAGGEWRDDWQPVTDDALPDAVEVTVASAAIPPLRQVFLVGPGPAA
ncbi:type II secretion system minor pseudopilin GspJ [Polymorphobacter fuscus]|uniref:Type II secretion system protein J n=1 Tax=Sandarakinorhabdus fusca TaxID=1439888 RepID=A0A7C9GPC0_9SPHN|nr:type II secretion system minor pseudopilin GspJ [Polymorphobacter fuscus]KAB7648993.1 type II secretion system protein GspJ [Polymorphobacter fuscus]MQT16590.1 type II secretion system protein GspJ [Polymorphobacter fuscus]NJC07120.1 general secretion pathway protein J [Polymorphobacter fuscus]